MKGVICIVFLALGGVSSGAQNTTLVEGSKTLVELISVLKGNRAGLKASPADSCGGKQYADLCFKNSLSYGLFISLFRRSDTGYAAQPLSVRVLTRKQECLLDMRPGIYKYRIELDTGVVKTAYREGELKLLPCTNLFREIKN